MRFLLLILFLNITFSYQIIQNLTPDYYKTHCCYTEYCFITLDNTEIRLSKNDCLYIPNPKQYEKLTFSSIKRSYEILFSQQDCQINETINREEFFYLITISCKKPHYINITKELNIFQKPPKPTTFLTKKIPITQEEQLFFITIDNKLVKAITIPKKATLKTNIQKTEDGFILTIITNKPLTCNLQPSVGYTLSFSQIYVQQRAQISLEKSQTSSIQQKQPAVKIECLDEHNFKYTNTITYFQKTEKENPSQQLFNFLKDYWLFFILLILVYYLYGAITLYKEKNKKAKEELEKE